MLLEKSINKPDGPYAMVRDNSAEHLMLVLAGWVVTDHQEGWLHMEPPLKPTQPLN